MNRELKSACLKSSKNNNYLSINKKNRVLEVTSNTVIFFNILVTDSYRIILQSEDGYYIKFDESDNTLKANVLDKEKATRFNISYINKKEVYLKMDGNNYLYVDCDDVVKSGINARVTSSKFKLKQRNTKKIRENLPVKIYEHINYGGKVQELGIGSYNLNQLTLANDTLSSLKITNGIFVTLYEHIDFKGKSITLAGDIPYVGNDFNDKMSSMKVEYEPQNVVKIYQHIDYTGRVQVLGIGSYDVDKLNIGNDTLSSVKVPQGYTITLYEHANYQGKSIKLTSDTPFVGKEFNDITSSIKVEYIQVDPLFKYPSEVLNLINKERGNRKISPLIQNNDLCKVAMIKSQDMVTNNYFNHISPTYGSPFDMMKKFGINFSYAAENLAWGQNTQNDVFNSWMNSTGHRDNMLNSIYTDACVGVAKKANGVLYWTLLLIKK